MGNRLPLIDENGEVRELTKEDFARARPASEVLPEILGPEVAEEFLKPRPRGPQKKPRKTSTTMGAVTGWGTTLDRRFATTVEPISRLSPNL